MATTMETLAASPGLLRDRYTRIRNESLRLIEDLEPEDTVVQSMPDVSPTRWHLAHVTWFFECFVLEPCGVPLFNDAYHYLFNSYYNSVGDMHPRPQRGLLSRPTLAEVLTWREHVDAAMLGVLEAGRLDDAALQVLEVGLNHEQQHQELMLTDIKHVLSLNPLKPVGLRILGGRRGHRADRRRR